MSRVGDSEPEVRAEKRENGIPSEAEEQEALFEWAAWMQGTYPELALMFHIPNGGSRNKAEAARFKAQGVKPGVPDILLPAPRGRFHGLFIELKRLRDGKISNDQKLFLTALGGQGYKCLVCFGAEEAEREIVKYLEGK